MGVEMPPVKHVHLQHVVRTVCALEAVVLRSFGPEGGQVLFTRDTGQAMLSRSGTRILKALRLEHPLARMVVECVWKHSCATGDGSKTFILLLASLLREIQTQASKEPNVSRMYKAREAAEATTARRLADDLLAFALDELEDLIAIGVAPYGCCVCLEDFLVKPQPPAADTSVHCVQKILASFFHTRLGHTHCDLMSNLTGELLGHFMSKNDQPSSTLEFINDNFSALHTPVTGSPISSSRLIEGQIIHRDFSAHHAQTDQQPVKAVVLNENLQPKLLHAGDVFEVRLGTQVTEEKTIVELSAWSEKSLECVIAKLQCLGVSVLLSAVKQSAAVLASAAQAEMCVVECVAEDELALFAKLSGTTPVSDGWGIEPGNVATLQFCRPISLGGHRYVHVAFPDREEGVEVRPCSLVICGAGEGQTDQYACAVQDALRLLLTSRKPVGVTAKGMSQTCLHTGRLVPGGGTFEILLNNALLQHGSRSNPAVSHLLANALLSVPRQIYSHRPRHFLQIQTRILDFIPKDSHTYGLLQEQEPSMSLIQGCGAGEFPFVDCKPSTHCCGEANVLSEAFTLDPGLESVSCKYQLLLAVVQCVAGLLRVDVVLHKHAASLTQSCRAANTSWEGTEDEAED